MLLRVLSRPAIRGEPPPWKALCKGSECHHGAGDAAQRGARKREGTVPDRGRKKLRGCPCGDSRGGTVSSAWSEGQGGKRRPVLEDKFFIGEQLFKI